MVKRQKVSKAIICLKILTLLVEVYFYKKRRKKVENNYLHMSKMIFVIVPFAKQFYNAGNYSLIKSHFA